MSGFCGKSQSDSIFFSKSAHLQEPVAAPVERREDGGMDIAAVDALQSEVKRLYRMGPRAIGRVRRCGAGQGVFRHFRPWGVL